MSEHTVALGDIFEDLDPRMQRCDIVGNRGMWRRRFKVIGLESSRGLPKVIVVDLDTGRHTRIRWDRLMREGRRGYRRVDYDPAYGPKV